MAQSGLMPAPCRLVRPPRVAASPCALECKLLQIIELVDLDGKPSHRHVVFGQVVGVHIDDRFIKDAPRHRGDGADRALRLCRLCCRRQGVLDCAAKGRRSGVRCPASGSGLLFLTPDIPTPDPCYAVWI
jgi:hypothetical protein